MATRDLFLFLALVLFLIVPNVSAGAPKEVTVAAVDGMVIDMDRSVLQRLKVRVKSLGPGFCSVRVRFGGAMVNLMAPPLAWSEWMSVGDAIAGGAHRLNVSPQCSVGAIAEVRYFRTSP